MQKPTKDRKGNAIGQGDVLIAYRDDGENLPFRVLDIDSLHGSGAAHLESLNPAVEKKFRRRWESRHWLWRMYEKVMPVNTIDTVNLVDGRQIKVEIEHIEVPDVCEIHQIWFENKIRPVRQEAGQWCEQALTA